MQNTTKNMHGARLTETANPVDTVPGFAFSLGSNGISRLPLDREVIGKSVETPVGAVGEVVETTPSPSPSPEDGRR